MKDFFDLRYVASEFRFDGINLTKAVKATFDRRKTELPDSRPIGLSSRFASNETVRKRWIAFLRLSQLEPLSLDLQTVVDEIWTFLEPVTNAVISENLLDMQWEPWGPWKSNADLPQ